VLVQRGPVSHPVMGRSKTKRGHRIGMNRDGKRCFAMNRTMASLAGLNEGLRVTAFPLLTCCAANDLDPRPGSVAA
jgi:hypothetical protein